MARKIETEEEAAVPEGDIQKLQLRRMVKVLFAFFGVAIGVLGMTASIFFYFTTASAIGSMQTAVGNQLSAVNQAVGDADEMVVGIQGSISEVPPLTENLSAALNHTATATGGISTSLGVLADTLGGNPLVPIDTASIRSSADEMANASASFRASGESMGRLSSDARGVQSDMAGVRANIANSRAALVSARENIDSAFNTLRFSALLISLMFFFAFALLMTYAVTTLI